MKRYLMSVLALTIIFALLPVSDSAAQLKWEGGVKGGLSMANLSGDDVEDTSMKMGAIGGAFFTAHITEMFAVQLEGLYAQKGAEFEYSDSADVTVTEKIKLDYIEIPLLAVASFEAAEKITINVFAGPALALLLSAKAEDFDIKDFTKSMDFGAAVGAGFKYAMEAFTVVVEGRYTLGLTTIDDTEDEEDVKNSNISIMAGFSIPFGGAAE